MIVAVGRAVGVLERPFSKVEGAMKRANDAVQRVARSSAWQNRRWAAVAVLLWKEMGPSVRVA